MLQRIDNVRLLVEAGADIDAREGGSMITPLHRAVYVDSYDIAHYLLEQGADSTLENKMGHLPADTIKTFKNRGVGREMHGWHLKVVERLGLDPDEVTLP
ncbi:MAG: ankyrin repeat domain-containing protein [Gammaproteobacteria bacterium]|nr:ankyrin repeat domain-containing protein [Gammaproteobacteria bacterium]